MTMISRRLLRKPTCAAEQLVSDTVGDKLCRAVPEHECDERRSFERGRMFASAACTLRV